MHQTHQEYSNYNIHLGLDQIKDIRLDAYSNIYIYIYIQLYNGSNESNTVYKLVWNEWSILHNGLARIQ